MSRVHPWMSDVTHMFAEALNHFKSRGHTHEWEAHVTLLVSRMHTNLHVWLTYMFAGKTVNVNVASFEVIDTHERSHVTFIVYGRVWNQSC